MKIDSDLLKEKLMKTAKVRVHREWFFPLKKPKCSCGSKTEVFGWYEYHNCRKYLVQYFCENCQDTVVNRLVEHADPCGCTFELAGNPPDFLKARALACNFQV